MYYIPLHYFSAYTLKALYLYLFEIIEQMWLACHDAADEAETLIIKNRYDENKFFEST